MVILLVAATEMEINEFLLTGLSEVNKHIEIDTLITGIGIAASIYELTKTLTVKKYDYVIQAGIGGSFSKKLNLGEVVTISKDCFAEMGVSEKNNFKSFYEIGLIDGNVAPYENGWLNNQSSFEKHFKLKTAVGITVNGLTDSKKIIKLFKNKFVAEVETMEGASLHYTCLILNQPFIQIRSISNFVGERNKEKWEIKIALKNLNKELLSVIKTISKIK